MAILLRNLKGETPVYARSVLKQVLGKATAGSAAQQKAVLLELQVCTCSWRHVLRFVHTGQFLPCSYVPTCVGSQLVVLAVPQEHVQRRADVDDLPLA